MYQHFKFVQNKIIKIFLKKNKPNFRLLFNFGNFEIDIFYSLV